MMISLKCHWDCSPYRMQIAAAIFILYLLNQREIFCIRWRTSFCDRANSKQAESNDGVSVTYRTVDDSDFRTECLRLVQTYLSDCRVYDGTPVTYRGIAKCDLVCKEEIT
ncbi:MAG: hypothetical protein HFE78_08490 [Clostridiales bacterium]|nr:hypothetical protein [Clostridiales bacterium]